jgi:hypothetical protein
VSVNRPTPARFPLVPGKPLVFRCRRRGVWGFYCQCAGYARTGSISSEQPNRDDHADAMRAALAHVEHWHKSSAAIEAEALEALFAAPAYEEVDQ